MGVLGIVGGRAEKSAEAFREHKLVMFHVPVPEYFIAKRHFFLQFWCDINSVFLNRDYHSTIMQVSQGKIDKWSHLHRKYGYEIKIIMLFWLLDTLLPCGFLEKTLFVPGACSPLFSTLVGGMLRLVGVVRGSWD